MASSVTPGLDPGVQTGLDAARVTWPFKRVSKAILDARVEPGHDNKTTAGD
jgi:hypothetical protein